MSSNTGDDPRAQGAPRGPTPFKPGTPPKPSTPFTPSNGNGSGDGGKYTANGYTPSQRLPEQLIAPGRGNVAGYADDDESGKVDVVQEVVHHISKFVRQQPASALLISFCVGGLAAWLVSKKSK